MPTKYVLYCGSQETMGSLFKACFFTFSLLPAISWVTIIKKWVNSHGEGLCLGSRGSPGTSNFFVVIGSMTGGLKRWWQMVESTSDLWRQGRTHYHSLWGCPRSKQNSKLFTETEFSSKLFDIGNLIGRTIWTGYIVIILTCLHWSLRILSTNGVKSICHAGVIDIR